MTLKKDWNNIRMKIGLSMKLLLISKKIFDLKWNWTMWPNIAVLTKLHFFYKI